MSQKKHDHTPAERWYQTRTVRNLCVAILSLGVILLAWQLVPFVDRIFEVLVITLLPFLLSLILYYLTRPLVQFFYKKMSIYLAITLVYLLLAGLITCVIVFVYPNIEKQIDMLRQENFESIIAKAFQSLQFLELTSNHSETSKEVKKFISSIFSDLNNILLSNIVSLISYVTEILIYICVIPIILFYMLKDDHKIYKRFCEFIPKRYLKGTKSFLSAVDFTLNHFITGRVIVAACMSSLLFICYLALGINYSYLLALIAFIFYIIPTIGWALASILPFIVSFTMGTFTGIEMTIILLAAASIEGLWVTPEILGLTMTIHPLTIILLLFVAGYLFGMIGVLFATPAYALLKIVAAHIYESLPERYKGNA